MLFLIYWSCAPWCLFVRRSVYLTKIDVLDLGNFSLIYIVNSKSCRHYSSETVRLSILIFIHVISNILKLCTLVSVCPSVRLFGQNLRLNLSNFSLIYIVNTKSCRHYSSETVRRSIFIFIYVIPNILKLCTLVSVCPPARLFRPNLTSKLRAIFHILPWSYCTRFHKCPALGYRYIISPKSFCVTDITPWRGIRVPTGHISSLFYKTLWNLWKCNMHSLWVSLGSLEAGPLSYNGCPCLLVLLMIRACEDY